VPDDTVKENTADVVINKKFVATAKIARLFADADALVAITHFKGHMITGFGGALKNLGMGCATREGKLMQHNDVTPVFYEDKCIGCGECEKICPVGAVRVTDGKCALSKETCIGCGSCVGVCPAMALFVDLTAGDACQFKMVEYAYAALRGKERRSGFINFAVRINQECDCWGGENPRIAPDIGILASRDPVSIDKASMDLVNRACGKDIFREVHPEQNGMKQLEYAQELGLGSLEYELIEV
ncbi:MAG TPA: DUF362 domain-containing protein, partial [bacterium]|nr:DUF362 domain-containing protein [bacterium]